MILLPVSLAFKQIRYLARRDGREPAGKQRALLWFKLAQIGAVVVNAVQKDVRNGVLPIVRAYVEIVGRRRVAEQPFQEYAERSNSCFAIAIQLRKEIRAGVFKIYRYILR